MPAAPTGGRRSQRRGHVRSYVAPGLPTYRPVRSPLVSMGPSLVEQRRTRTRLRRGLVLGLLLVLLVAGITTLVQVLSERVPLTTTAAPRARLALATNRPEPLTLVLVEGVQLRLPINRRGITAIGYATINDPRALPMDPEGARADVSLPGRVFRRFLATEQPGKLRYYLLDGTSNPNMVEVGAPAGASVFAPISGTVVAIAPNVIDGEPQGHVLQVQPLGDAETVVVLRNLDVDGDLAPGMTVSEGTTLLGHVRSMAGVQEQPLRPYTNDGGDSLEMHVRRVPTTQPLSSGR